MENSSRSLLIAGAILIAVLVVAVGMYIYNTATVPMANNSSMNTYEIDAFNNQFVSYSGNIKGSSVKSLLQVLAANASTNEFEPSKVPTVTIVDKLSLNSRKDLQQCNISYEDPKEIKNYTNGMALMRTDIESKHVYLVEFDYGTSGLIENINITYDVK